MSNEQLVISNEELGMRNENAAILPTPHCSLLTSHSPFPFISLQWFADDDEDTPGKTEQPTDIKLRRLREEGQVAKSQELVSALGLLLPAVLLLFLAPYMLRTCVEMLRFFFLRVTEMDPTKDAMIARIFLRYFIRLVWPILAVAFVTAIFSNLVQIGGWLFTTKPLEPNFSRIVPRFGQYFRRIFSVDGIFNLIKSIGKMAIIGFVAYFLIMADINKLLNLQKTDLYTGLTIVASIAIKMLIFAALFLLVIAVIDFIFQRWRFRERNKMTRYEQKEEHKQYEGDPLVQSRIRGRFRDLLRQNLQAAVPKADVVITNPTHLAIAVQYDSRLMEGPMVVAKGADEMAARIREIAREHNVPLVEDKPLARDLYRFTKVGDIIPQAYWSTIGLIFRKVWYMNEEKRRRLSA